jgi:flagellar biosynthetic protein FliP
MSKHSVCRGTTATDGRRAVPVCAGGARAAARRPDLAGAVPVCAEGAASRQSLRLLRWPALVLAAGLVLCPAAAAQDGANRPARVEGPAGLLGGPAAWTSPEGLSGTLQVALLLTVLSLAPAVVLMTTCFVRIVVVLGLLRQALGTQQLPPSQVITSLALFLTLLVMAPVWKQVYAEAVVPYTHRKLSLEEAWEAGVQPIRRFMSLQIERTNNAETVWLFLDYLPDAPQPSTYDEVPLAALVPAFMLSELKTAFVIGFQIYLPFLILDMVISTVLISMGMLMLPPVLVSLPLKLLLFVLVDGWYLVVGMLLESFQPFS